MTFTPALLDQLLAEGGPTADLLGPDGLFDQLKKALAERALGAELTEHLAAEAATPTPGRRNHRNGSTAKTVQTATGRTGERVHFADAPQELGPPAPRLPERQRLGLGHGYRRHAGIRGRLAPRAARPVGTN